MNTPTTNTPASAPPHRLKAITVLGTGMDARYARKGLHLVHSAANTPAAQGGCAPGIGCMRQHDCADTYCPGRPKHAPRHRHEGLSRVDTAHDQAGGIYLGPVLPADDAEFEAEYARFKRGAMRTYAAVLAVVLVLLAFWAGV